MDEVEKISTRERRSSKPASRPRARKLQKQLETALATVRPGLVAHVPRWRRFRPSSTRNSRALRTSTRLSWPSVKALVPQQATVDAAIDSAAAPVLAALDALNQEVEQL